MPHLHLVSAHHGSTEPSGETPTGAPHQLHLHLAGVPAPTGEPDQFFELPEPSPQLSVTFGQMDLLMDALSPAQALEFASVCYLDANHAVRVRTLSVCS